MSDVESTKSAELNADHGDVEPGFGAGFGGFVTVIATAADVTPARKGGVCFKWKTSE